MTSARTKSAAASRRRHSREEARRRVSTWTSSPRRLRRKTEANGSTGGAWETTRTMLPGGSDAIASRSGAETSRWITSRAAPGAMRASVASWYGSTTARAPESRPGSRASSSGVARPAGIPSAPRISCTMRSAISGLGSTTSTRSGGAAASQRSTATRTSAPVKPLAKAACRARRIISSRPRASVRIRGPPPRTNTPDPRCSSTWPAASRSW